MHLACVIYFLLLRGMYFNLYYVLYIQYTFHTSDM